MNIRDAENQLFNEWRNKYIDKSFVIDGCPNPDIYLQEKRKVVFVLKDGNLGEPNPTDTINDRTYDQRDELEKTPTLWWNTIGRWAYFLRNTSDSWDVAQNVIKDEKSIREILSHHCIVQLKKTWGGGAVTNDTLASVVANDKNEVYRQLSIYQPDFIVACGNGEHLSKVFNLEARPYLKTSTGVGYWKVQLKNKACILVDYCHPSNRAGTKVKGIIAKGLSCAVLEIEQSKITARWLD